MRRRYPQSQHPIVIFAWHLKYGLREYLMQDMNHIGACNSFLKRAVDHSQSWASYVYICDSEDMSERIQNSWILTGRVMGEPERYAHVRHFDRGREPDYTEKNIRIIDTLPPYLQSLRIATWDDGLRITTLPDTLTKLIVCDTKYDRLPVPYPPNLKILHCGHLTFEDITPPRHLDQVRLFTDEATRIGYIPPVFPPTFDGYPDYPCTYINVGDQVHHVSIGPDMPFEEDYEVKLGRNIRTCSIHIRYNGYSRSPRDWSRVCHEVIDALSGLYFTSRNVKVTAYVIDKTRTHPRPFLLLSLEDVVPQEGIVHINVTSFFGASTRNILRFFGPSRQEWIPSFYEECLENYEKELLKIFKGERRGLRPDSHSYKDARGVPINFTKFSTIVT